MSLEASGLCKAYGKHVALRALEVKVGPGELVALVGENGAGKSTSLGILSGRIVPDRGHALLAGFDLFKAPLEARRRMAYVAQDLFSPPHLSIEELARFVCGVKGITPPPGELARLLALAGLAERGDRLIGELSHGMQRKAAWVVALLSRPALLLLDEGLAGLDATSCEALVGEIGRLMGQGLAVLWTEHELSLIAPLATRVLVLRGGSQAESLDGDALRELQRQGQLAAQVRRWTGPL